MYASFLVSIPSPYRYPVLLMNMTYNPMSTYRSKHSDTMTVVNYNQKDKYVVLHNIELNTPLTYENKAPYIHTESIKHGK